MRMNGSHFPARYVNKHRSWNIFSKKQQLCVNIMVGVTDRVVLHSGGFFDYTIQKQPTLFYFNWTAATLESTLVHSEQIITKTVEQWWCARF